MAFYSYAVTTRLVPARLVMSNRRGAKCRDPAICREKLSAAGEQRRPSWVTWHRLSRLLGFGLMVPVPQLPLSASAAGSGAALQRQSPWVRR